MRASSNLRSWISKRRDAREFVPREARYVSADLVVSHETVACTGCWRKLVLQWEQLVISGAGGPASFVLKCAGQL